jgi:hypothetical protein
LGVPMPAGHVIGEKTSYFQSVGEVTEGEET